ncbi:Phage tail protein [Cupriavidus sp. H19C3]|uniref:DUF7666 domain-containing protein n=1 Tax=Cupriavidus sp. H19C3 TaxID=3241603 RepID=UPI003BF84332
MQEKKTDAAEVITSYKGFDKDMQCRGFQYEVGKTYEHEGEVSACGSGFHACGYPLDVFGYYPPAGSRFAIVQQSGDLSREEDGDTKVASRKLTVSAEISIVGLIKAAIEYTTSRCLPIDPESPASSTGDQGAASSTGDQGAASSTGDRGAASSTGYQGAASSTGDRGAASSTGYRGAASSTGYRGAASSTGYQGAASSTGDQGAASSTGDRGAASSTGYQGAASSTGYQGAASSTGYQGAASSTGYQGVASSTGDRGVASSTGDRGAASALGKHSAAMSSGFYGKAKGIDGAAIFLVFRDVDGEGDEYGRIVHARAAIVGRDGIKPDTFYTLNAEGEIVEAEDK